LLNISKIAGRLDLGDDALNRSLAAWLTATEERKSRNREAPDQQ
jgi:hypothetical protein